MNPSPRPEIRFIPLSSDEGKIRFFGTLMPALLLFRASPVQFLRHQVSARLALRSAVASFVASETDDAAWAEDVIVFVHRWESEGFDPFAFARAKTFLARVTRRLRCEGYDAQPLDPLSPRVNLPNLAARAGLGNLSPYGLLVHPVFGPRLVLTGLKTDYPLAASPRWQGTGCSDCLACIRHCPQDPGETGVIDLGKCHSCALCLTVCPVGNGTES